MVKLISFREERQWGFKGSICWFCSKAYPDQCAFHDNDLTWEGRLSIPKVVAKEVAIIITPTKEREVPLYRVKECDFFELAPKAEEETDFLNFWRAKEKREAMELETQVGTNTAAAR